MSELLLVYTDGASGNKNGKPGGWGVVIVRNPEFEKDQAVAGTVIHQEFGGHPETSNNRMEITALGVGLVRALAMKTPTERIVLVSDSQYALGVCSGQMYAQANKDLIGRFKSRLGQEKVEFRWVKGHNGDRFNEMADELAGIGKENARISKEAASKGG